MRNIIIKDPATDSQVSETKKTVMQERATVNVYSLNGNDLMLFKYEEGCLKRVKVFNSCEVESVLKRIDANH